MASLADITHDALVASGLGQRDFAKLLGVGGSTLTNLLKGGKVKDPTIAALVKHCPERAAEIKRAARRYDPRDKRGGRTPKPARDGADLHAKRRPGVRFDEGLRSPQQQPEPREEEVPFPNDPVKSGVVRIYDGLSDEGRLEALTAMGKIAQRDRLRSATSKTQG